MTLDRKKWIKGVAMRKLDQPLPYDFEGMLKKKIIDAHIFPS